MQDGIPRNPHGRDVTSIVDVLRARAAATPDRVAYEFLDDRADVPAGGASITYAELDRGARAIAALLQANAAPGDRAILVYPTGPDYLRALLGCLYAGIVAVPAYPPEYGRLAGRVATIIANCRPRVVLTTSAILRKSRHAPGPGQPGSGQPGSAVRWITTDDAFAGLEHMFRSTELERHGLAVLQYTSGSSGDPKGVMVSHAGLLDNLQRLRDAFGYTEDDRQVTWLPPYHDMGLIASLLSALYTGHPCTVMSPFAFLLDPLRWLAEISHRRATCTGAPNFAYELCVRKVSDERLRELDLRSLRLAFCGAEPVRVQTVKAFAQTFAPAGFRAEAFRPAYGLAEATVFVSTTPADTLPAIVALDRDAFGRGALIDAPDARDAVRAVSCGPAMAGHDVVIVNPDTRVLCEPAAIGEIWISGPSISKGYWEQPEATRETFDGRLALADEARRHPGPFLRTGDLAFQRAGELFIAGRLKDVIVIRGVNRYPQDIELTAERSHPMLRPGCGAAFAADPGPAGDQERLVILHEVNPGDLGRTEGALAAIRAAVRDEHQLDVSAILLIEPRTLPKTTSGKIARRPSRQAYLAGALKVVASWVAPVAS
jgi:acyl-CoA synthetase (AMP-forming)/AMP-acid ligase II